MNDKDGARFGIALSGLYEVLATKELTDAAMSIWWETLKEFPIEVVERAMIKHAATGKYHPKPSDIREVITGAMRSQWPTADEAWANAINAADEQETVIWTEESCKAFYGAAKPLLDLGDKIAARRAYIDAYDRSVAESMARGKPPKVIVSEGLDKQRKVDAIKQAEMMGQIGHETASQYLLGHEEPTQDGNAIAGLITGKVQEPAKSADVLERINSIKEQIKQSTPEPVDRAEQQRQAREQYEQTKRETIDNLKRAYNIP